MTVRPSSVADWRIFLQEYSAEFLVSQFLQGMKLDDRGDQFVSAEQRESRWLGNPAATEEQIVGTEQRLGIRLPPSLRNFYLVSNGWKTVCYSVDLLPIDEIGWFAEQEPELLDAWADLEFFVEELAVLRRCLLVSVDDGGAGEYLLLLPEVGPDGEWPAYDWWPGSGEDPDSHEDFAAMLTLFRRNESYGPPADAGGGDPDR